MAIGLKVRTGGHWVKGYGNPSFVLVAIGLKVRTGGHWVKGYGNPSFVLVAIGLKATETHHRVAQRHLPYGITLCYLRPILPPPKQAGAQNTYTGGIEG